MLSHMYKNDFYVTSLYFSILSSPDLPSKMFNKKGGVGGGLST